jgi:hypothetical protein
MRNAIILPLGMLNEKVNTNPFIIKLLQQAKQSNPNFVFDDDLQKQAFALAEAFNKNTIDQDNFKSQLLAIFNINIDDNQFWQSWNEMVVVGNIKQKLAELQTFADQNNLIVYLHSDTNLVHLKLMQDAWAAQGISFSEAENVIILQQLPLYISCLQGKTRLELIQKMVELIKAQNFPPQHILLLQGRPANISNADYRKQVEEKNQPIIQLCHSSKIELVWHQNNTDLLQTLQQAFATVPETSSASSLGI